jgi:hypothetical protein
MERLLEESHIWCAAQQNKGGREMSFKRSLVCLFALTLTSGILWAQKAPKAAHTTRSGVITPMRIPSNFKTIFSNLGPSVVNGYNATTGYYVLGPNNSVGLGEQWIALPFTPMYDSHVTLLSGAISIQSGTSLVDLALYSDNGGTVGTLIAGGSATKIPAFGTCCQLVNVSIPSTAVSKGTQYWIVATTDDVNGPDFTGVFDASNGSTISYNPQLIRWFNFSGNVPAAAVRGSIP